MDMGQTVILVGHLQPGNFRVENGKLVGEIGIEFERNLQPMPNFEWEGNTLGQLVNSQGCGAPQGWSWIAQGMTEVFVATGWAKPGMEAHVYGLSSLSCSPVTAEIVSGAPPCPEFPNGKPSGIRVMFARPVDAERITFGWTVRSPR